METKPTPKMDVLDTGMSLRTYIATSALQGILSAYSGEGVALPDENSAAKSAVEYAEALLRRLKATS